MSDRQILANQTKILRNQTRLLANQGKLDQILRNQKEIKANQGSILANQRKLDQVLRNQKTIEANQEDPRKPDTDPRPNAGPDLTSSRGAHSGFVVLRRTSRRPTIVAARPCRGGRGVYRLQ